MHKGGLVKSDKPLILDTTHYIPVRYARRLKEFDMGNLTRRIDINILGEEDKPKILEALRNIEEAVKRLKRERVLAPIRKDLEVNMQTVFRKQGRLFAKGMVKYKGLFSEAFGESEIGSIAGIVEIDTAEEMTGVIHAGSSAAMEAGMSAAAEWGVNVALALKNPRAVEWLESHAAEMVTKINETTRGDIASLVKRGVEEGWSYNKTAREISGRYEEFAIGKPQLHIESRAHLVAVTESANAYGQGNRQSIDTLTAAGLEMEHDWNTMGDDLVSEGCLENEAAGWIPLDESFPSGDDEEPRFPGCRCYVAYRRVGTGEG